MESLLKRLNYTEEEFRDKLMNLYENDLSQMKISQLFGCYSSTIECYFKKFNISTRNCRERMMIVKRRNVTLNKAEQEILNGLLLSDLHIDIGTFQGRITFGVLHKEFADSIISNLSSIKWTELYPYKSTNSSNVNYFGKSKFYEELYNLHSVWYKDKIKIVPVNLNDISPLTLYWWFLGDGCNSSKRKHLSLCTEAFSKEDNERLVSILNYTYNIPFWVDTRNRISIYGIDHIKKFLNIIGVPKIKCYEYKWKC